MNSRIIKGNRDDGTDKLKQQFTNPAAAELLFNKEKEEELLGRVQNRLGKSREEFSEGLLRMWLMLEKHSMIFRKKRLTRNRF